MTVFLDTSAVLAVLDADDQFHAPARDVWNDLVERAETMVCTSYVLVETFALVQSRLGMDAVRVLVDDILPLDGRCGPAHRRPPPAQPGRLRQLRGHAPAQSPNSVRVR